MNMKTPDKQKKVGEIIARAKKEGGLNENYCK